MLDDVDPTPTYNTDREFLPNGFLRVISCCSVDWAGIDNLACFKMGASLISNLKSPNNYRFKFIIFKYIKTYKRK